MRTMIAILLFAPILVSGQENSTEKFVELNVGMASIDGYSYSLDFPGASCYGVKRIKLQKIEFSSTR